MTAHRHLLASSALTRVRLAGNEYQLDYAFDPDIPAIPNAVLTELAGELGIGEWEFSRTHWAVKDADLFRALLKRGLGNRPQPKVFALNDEPVNADLVAVMMPFDARFHPRYLPNGEGLRQLQGEVQRRLEALRGRR
jgi:hypothetical protein